MSACQNNNSFLECGKWVFGGMERGSDNVFMEVVAACDTATLLPIIQRNVLPGTDVYSDECRGILPLPGSKWLLT